VPRLASADGSSGVVLSSLSNLVCRESLEASGRFTPPEGPKARGSSSIMIALDTLKSPHDDKLFEYYTQTQIVAALMSPSGAASTLSGQLLVTEITGPPFSRSLLMSRFGRQFSVLSLAPEGDEGPQYFPLHQRAAQEDRPNRFDACPPGPRGFRW
ncbi:hypothetical protein FOZ63_016652, partial [Perkinsus olseni]